MSAQALHAIALSDARIALLGADGAHFEEPGVALAAAGDVRRARFGFAARRASRANPRALCDRIWSEPDGEAASAARSESGGVRNCDLAHAQLSALLQRVAEPRAPVLLIVPASYHERGALGVLLGIAQAAGFHVRALMETPLAASAAPWPNVARAHLELDEHDCVLTLLDQSETVQKRAVRPLAEHGLRRVRDALFAQAARALLASPARFDAFGSAESEQAVHDALFTSIAPTPMTALRFSHAGRALEVQLEAREQEAALEKFTGAVCAHVARAFAHTAPTPPGIELGAFAACVPGLARALETKCGAQVRTLAPNADLEGAHAHAAHILAHSDDKVRLLTALPWA